MELKIQPEELTFVSAKYLQDQASRVERNMVVMETEYRIDKNKNNTSIDNNNSNEENSHLKSEHLAINNTSIVRGTKIKTFKKLVLRLIYQ